MKCLSALLNSWADYYFENLGIRGSVTVLRASIYYLKKCALKLGTWCWSYLWKNSTSNGGSRRLKKIA